MALAGACLVISAAPAGALAAGGLLVAGEAGATSCEAPPPAASARGTQDVECSPTSADALYRFDLQSGGLKRLYRTSLATLGMAITGGAVAPDGAGIAFSAPAAGGGDPVLFTIPTAGGPARALGSPGGHVSWSPDGKWIAADRWSAGKKEYRLFRIRSSGSHTYQLGVGAQPTWSRSGKIAFVRANGPYGHSGLFVVDPSGRHARAMKTGVHWRTSRPAWSPDARRLAFVAERQGSDGQRSGAVFSVPAGGGSARQLTAFVPCLNFGDCLRDLVWSPTGNQLAVSYGRDDAVSDAPDVYLVKTQAGAPQPQRAWQRVMTNATALGWFAR